MKRRSLLVAGSVWAGWGAASLPTRAATQPHVVVVGGGFAGATAARYVRLLSAQRIAVTLVEPEASLVSCPLSNLVLAGYLGLADLTQSRAALTERLGVRVVRARAQRVDAAGRQVVLDDGSSLPFDRAIVAPGIDLPWTPYAGMQSADAQQRVLHAWKAGVQTLALRQQLQAMPDGGVVAITVPAAPYRCPPGPYERSCLVADYLLHHKPRSKVLVFDANEDVTSKGPLFKRVWAERYPGMVEYRPRHVLQDVDATAGRLLFEVQEPEKAHVLNVLPPMQAGAVAVNSALVGPGQRWCDVDFSTLESRLAPGVHVIGDATQNAPNMPKSAHMANQHAKVCALAVVSRLLEQDAPPRPVINNTCYSFVSEREAMHVASVHRYDEARRTLVPVQGAGGVSDAPSLAEGQLAHAWARNLWADALHL